jgi:DNA-binding HxlR family transcriptional regulator
MAATVDPKEVGSCPLPDCWEGKAMAKGKGPYVCGLDAAVDVVGGKWKPMILWALHDGGTLRFGELRRHVAGVSEKVLIQHLRELEADGIVHREVYREVPPRVEYSLTELGQALNTALLPLGEWGDIFMERIVANKTANKTKEPVA